MFSLARTFTFFKNQFLLRVNKPDGSSMVEVLAASAAAAIVVMGSVKIASEMSRASTGAEVTQQRTNLDQELTTVFENPDNCTRALAGAASAENAQVNLNSLGAMNSTVAANSSSYDIADRLPVLDRVSLKSLTLTKVSTDLGGGTYRAVLVAAGNMKDSQKGTSGGSANSSGSFSSAIPVYYKASGGVVSGCLTTKSPYSTCMALNGSWNGSVCDFCATLGGTRAADGRCTITIAPAPPPPPPPPPVPPAPPAGPTDGSTTLAVLGRSLYNGYNDQSLGTHKWCSLTNYSYDGDGIGECTLTGGLNGNWNLHMGDEGTASPQLCYVTCSDGGSSANVGATNDGAMCSRGGRTGIMIGGCCATGNQFQIVMGRVGKGGYAPVGTINNIRCN